MVILEGWVCLYIQAMTCCWQGCSGCLPVRAAGVTTRSAALSAVRHHVIRVVLALGIPREPNALRDEIQTASGSSPAGEAVPAGSPPPRAGCPPPPRTLPATNSPAAGSSRGTPVAAAGERGERGGAAPAPPNGCSLAGPTPLWFGLLACPWIGQRPHALVQLECIKTGFLTHSPR